MKKLFISSLGFFLMAFTVHPHNTTNFTSPFNDSTIPGDTAKKAALNIEMHSSTFVAIARDTTAPGDTTKKTAWNSPAQEAHFRILSDSTILPTDTTKKRTAVYFLKNEYRFILHGETSHV